MNKREFTDNEFSHAATCLSSEKRIFMEKTYDYVQIFVVNGQTNKLS